MARSLIIHLTLILQLFSDVNSVVYPVLKGYFLWDLFPTEPIDFGALTFLWTVTNPKSISASRIGYCQSSPTPALLLGGLSLISQNTILERTYTSLPAHSYISYLLQVPDINQWSLSSDSITIKIDDNIVHTLHPRTDIGTGASNDCGTGNDFRWYLVVGVQSHSAGSLKITFVTSNSGYSSASFGIPGLTVLFRPSAPYVNNKVCHLSPIDWKLTAPCSSYGSQYLDTSGTLQTCSSACNNCFGPGAGNCFACSGNGYFDGSICRSCDNSCASCNGPNSNQCTRCNSGYTLQTDFTCSTNACSPNILDSIGGDFRQCISNPCSGQFIFYELDGSIICMSSCNTPYTKSSDNIYCSLCTSTQYRAYDSQGQLYCASTCNSPLIKQQNNQYCLTCPYGQYISYDTSGAQICVTSCSLPYQVMRNIYCLLCDLGQFISYDTSGQLQCVTTCTTPYQQMNNNKYCLLCPLTQYISYDTSGQLQCVGTCSTPYQKMGNNMYCLLCPLPQYISYDTSGTLQCLTTCTTPYQQMSNNMYCLLCPLTQYISYDTSGQLQCVTTCSAPYQKMSNNMYCLLCPLPQYISYDTSGSLQCLTTCTAPYQQMSNNMYCLLCPLTQYIFYDTLGQLQCLTPCPAPYQLMSNNMYCLLCPLPKYVSYDTSGQLQCLTSCSTPYQVMNSNIYCLLCPLSKSISYDTSGQLQCVTSCTAPYQLMSHNMYCLLCPIGKYIFYDTSGQLQCVTTCPSSYQIMNNNMYCLLCPLGKYISYDTSGQLQCLTSCLAPYQQMSNNFYCLLCPLTKYISYDASGQLQCVTTCTSPYQQMSNNMYCLLCPLPKYISYDTSGQLQCLTSCSAPYQPMSNNIYCLLCPLTKYISYDTSGQLQCVTPCTLPYQLMSNNMYCLLCPLGKYISYDTLGQLQCLVFCPDGYQKMGNNMYCLLCPLTKYISYDTSGQLVCLSNCPAPYQLMSNNMYCLLCLLSKYVSYDTSGQLQCVASCPAPYKLMNNNMYCLLCPLNMYISYNTTGQLVCQSYCTSPYQIKNNNMYCLICDLDKYISYNTLGQIVCLSSCPVPYQLKYNNMYCLLCNLNQFISYTFYGQLLCLSNCTTYPYRVKNSIYCIICDTDQFIFYNSSGGVTCLSDCSYPYKQLNSSHCILDPNDQSTDIALNIIMATQYSSTLLSRILLLFKPGASGLLLSGCLAEMLKYIRYLDIGYSVKLLRLFQMSSIGQIIFNTDPSKVGFVESKFSNYTLPRRFEDYYQQSDFLANSWKWLIIFVCSLLVVPLNTLIGKIKRPKFIKKLHQKIKEAFKWNFCISTFISFLGNFALFSSYQFFTAPSLHTPMDYVSLVTCIVTNVMMIALFFKAISVGMEIKRYTHLRTIKTEEDVESVRKQFPDFVIIFESYKMNSIVWQLCFAIYLVRVYIFYVIIVFPYKYPIAQSAVLIGISVVMLLYLGLVRPIREKAELFRSWSQEFILLVINICVNVLAILDSKGVTDVNDKRRIILEDVILWSNVVFFCVSLLYALIVAFELVREAAFSLKNKKAKKRVPGQRGATIGSQNGNSRLDISGISNTLHHNLSALDKSNANLNLLDVSLQQQSLSKGGNKKKMKEGSRKRVEQKDGLAIYPINDSMLQFPSKNHIEAGGLEKPLGKMNKDDSHIAAEVMFYAEQRGGKNIDKDEVKLKGRRIRRRKSIKPDEFPAVDINIIDISVEKIAQENVQQSNILRRPRPYFAKDVSSEVNKK